MAWAPDYCTPGELAEHMRIPDDADAETMLLAIAAASRAVDEATNRQFGSVTPAESRYYEPYWDTDLHKWVVETDDIHSSTGLEVHWDSVGDDTYATQITNYTLVPRNAAQKGRPWEGVVINDGFYSAGGYPHGYYPHGHRNTFIRVKALYGWSAVPTTIKQATVLQATRLVTRRDAPFGVSGSNESGELRLLSKLDADVAVILRPYYRWWGAV